MESTSLDNIEDKSLFVWKGKSKHLLLSIKMHFQL